MTEKMAQDPRWSCFLARKIYGPNILFIKTNVRCLT